jgi:hypothetical protein
MADDQKDLAQSTAPTAAHEAPSGGFWKSLADIYVDPAKVFARIDGGLSWWKPFIAISVVSVVIGYFMLPYRRKLLEIAFQGMPPERAQVALAQNDKFGLVGLIAVPIVFIIFLLIIAGLIHIVVNVMSPRSSFKKTLSLLTFCGLITLLEQIISTAVIMSRGVEGVETAADLVMSFSLAPLFPDVKGPLAALMQSLGIFEIWSYVVLILGIAAIFKISRKSAMIAAIPPWLLSFLGAWIGGKFQGGMR